MDIVYNIDNLKVIAYYNTTGFINITGSVRRSSIIHDVGHLLPTQKVAVWSWITLEEQMRVPKVFYKEYKDFYVVIDPITNSPVGLQYMDSNFVIKIPKPLNPDYPIIWHGLFLDTISYSLINRQMAFRLKDMGFNVKICSIKRSPDRHEISSEDMDRLISMGLNEKVYMNHESLNIHCYLPTDRVPPSRYAISYTMMECYGVQPVYVSALNSDYNECWFPCFVGNTGITTSNGYKPISSVRVGDMVLTHTGNYQKVKAISERDYVGDLIALDSHLCDDHLIGTPEHPIFVNIKQEDVLCTLGRLEAFNTWLKYPRDRREFGEDPIINLCDVLNVALPKGMSIDKGTFYWKEKSIGICQKELVYNHLLDEYVEWEYLLEGSGRIFYQIKADKDFFKMLAMYEYSKKKKYEEDEDDKYVMILHTDSADSAVEFSLLIKKVFASNTAKVFPHKLYGEVKLRSETLIEVLDACVRCVREDRGINLFKDVKLECVTEYLKAANKMFKLNSSCRSKISLSFPYYSETHKHMFVKHWFDLGYIPKICDNKVSLDYPQSQHFLEHGICEDKKDRDQKFMATSTTIYVKLKKKRIFSNQSVKVYNLEVENDNSYMANFAMAHNCNFNIEGFRDAGVVKPIRHMPLAIDHNKFYPGIEKRDIDFILLNPKFERFPVKPTGFKFMSVFRYSYRKGPDVLIKAFRKAFTKDDDVCLIIFSRSYLGTVENDSINTTEVVKNDLKRWLEEDENAAPIYWCKDYLPDDELPNIYGWGDCLCSTSRGEGTNLSLLEAGCCGIPVIAPNHSAMADYMRDEFGYVIHVDELKSCGMVMKENDEMKYYGDQPNWAGWITPGYINQLFPVFGNEVVYETSEHMKHVYGNYDEAKEKAKKFREYILDNYTWDIAMDRIAKRLREIKL